jgi:hypothetical protein
MKLLALLRQYLHCGAKPHRAIVGRGLRALYRGCECGKVFYDNCPPGYAAFMLRLYRRKPERAEAAR